MSELSDRAVRAERKAQCESPSGIKKYQAFTPSVAEDASELEFAQWLPE